MSDWTHLIAILPGIFAGMLLVSRVGHFAQIFTKTGVDTDDAPQADQRLSRNQILAVVVFLTGWVALFAATGLYIHVVKDGPAGWFWFFVGIAAARFSDGTFLCGCGRVTDSFALVWLPDSALHDAHPDEVLQFIDEKMRPRTVKRLKRLSAFARTGKVAGTTLE